MKKKLSLLLVALMGLSLVLVGCGNGANNVDLDYSKEVKNIESTYEKMDPETLDVRAIVDPEAETPSFDLTPENLEEMEPDQVYKYYIDGSIDIMTVTLDKLDKTIDDVLAEKELSGKEREDLISSMSEQIILFYSNFTQEVFNSMDEVKGTIGDGDKLTVEQSKEYISNARDQMLDEVEEVLNKYNS